MYVKDREIAMLHLYEFFSVNWNLWEYEGD